MRLRAAKETYLAASCATVLGLLLDGAAPARAEEDCQAEVSRQSLVGCALRASLRVRAELQGVDAMAARRTAAAPWLPSNPLVGFAVAHRQGSVGQGEDVNWYATLSQEVEVGGQRRWRKRGAEAEWQAQRLRWKVAEQDAAAQAWMAYFEALAAKAELALEQELERIAIGVAQVTRGMGAQGLLSEVEADVGAATATRMARERIAAERRLADCRAQLATLLGLDVNRADLRIEGELQPLNVPEGEPPMPWTERPEVLALQHDHQALQAQATGIKRKRVPNLRLHLLAQNDGFNERVLGGGVELPLPLPQPVGRVYQGEVAELQAHSERVLTLQEEQQRALRLQLVLAQQNVRSRQQELAAFEDELLVRAHGSLQRMAKEVEAGRLGVRDVLLTQQTLIDLLRGHIDARRQLCLASVQLARARGAATELGL